jgi:hypothetical protein
MSTYGQWITTKKRLAIYLRDDFTCLYCNTSLKDAHPNDITLDHMISRVYGGDNSQTNLLTACKPCNDRKNGTWWYRFATTEAIERICRYTRKPLNVELAESLLRRRKEARQAVPA